MVTARAFGAARRHRSSRPTIATSCACSCSPRPDADGPRTPDEQERLDAVRDMRDALKSKKGITVVDDPPRPTCRWKSSAANSGEEPAGGFGGKSITRMGDTIIRLRVKSGDEESDLKGMGQGTWARAAKDAADRFLKWIARREPKVRGCARDAGV